MRVAIVCVVVLLVASSAGAVEVPSIPVALVIPVVPSAMDHHLRDSLEVALVAVRAIGQLERVGGRRREPCGIVFRRGDRVVARASLVWRGGRVVERVEWDMRAGGDPIWERTRWLYRDGLVVREHRETMQYTEGRADCAGSQRRTFTRDARGRIVSVRSTVHTCEGVDAGTEHYRHVWRYRAGVEEAIVRPRHHRDAQGSVTSVRAMVPSERDAWAHVGGGGFSSWIDVRDADGFLRVRIEDEDALGLYDYACVGGAWPRGSTAPEVAPP